MATTALDAAIERVDASAFTVPTDRPESDGTLSWDTTTIVVAEASAGSARGLGYTYGAAATGVVIADLLADVVRGRDAMDVPGAWRAMVDAVRNVGRPGIASMAIAAVDVAVWDLKARLLDLPLVELLGRHRDAVPVYGSGGFTSYDDGALRDQLGGWVEAGIGRVKMKGGGTTRRRSAPGRRRPHRDPAERRADGGRERRLRPQAGRSGGGRGRRR